MAQANFLERLLAEWYSYQDWYVKTNVLVSPRSQGGYDGELDVVAYNPRSREVYHIETSMDAASWATRKQRFAKKFSLGQKHIPEFFPEHTTIKKVAVLAFVRGTRVPHPLGPDIEIRKMHEIYDEMHSILSKRRVDKAIVPENYPLVRSIQFYLHFGPQGRSILQM